MKKTLLLFAAFSFLLVSCGDDETYVAESDIVGTGGFIEITMSGKSRDGETINETFRLKKYPAMDYCPGGYYTETDNTDYDNYYSFYLTRVNDISGSVQVSISFDKNKNTSEIEDLDIDVEYVKNLPNNTLLTFYEYFSDNEPYWEEEINEVRVYNVTFDPVSGKINGSFDGKTNYEGSDYILSISGSFDCTIPKIVEK